MQIRRSVFWFIAVVVMLIALVLWFGKKQPVEIPPTASLGTNITLPVATAPSQSTSGTVETDMPITKAATGTNSPKLSAQDKGEQIREGLATLNDVPIVFYGRLEDQFGNPVVGAEITGTTIIRNGTKSGAERVSTISDSNGFFQLNAGKGESLGIMPHKDGYALAAKSTSFNYSYMYADHFTPDQNNPTIIKMWKLQGAEDLIHFQNEIHIPIDSSPVTLNLQTGQQVQSSGDITISVQTVSTPNVRQRYDWQAKIQATDGGLISSRDDFDKMFDAPDSGYEPEFDITYQKDVMPWTTTFNGVFYFTSRNGNCYGKLGIEILSDVVKNGTVPVILNSYVNPTGSRNLEIDPSKITEAKP